MWKHILYCLIAFTHYPVYAVLETGNCVIYLEKHPVFTLADIKKNKKFTNVSHNLWASGDFNRNPHEKEAAQKAATLLGSPIVLAGDIGDRKAIPGFDGVIFDSAGIPTSNISIKTAFIDEATSDSYGSTIATSRRRARQSLNKLYLNDFFTNEGFILKENYLYIQKGKKNQREAAMRMSDFMSLFGFFPDSRRKTTIVVDVKSEKANSMYFKIFNKSFTEGERAGKTDICMHIDRDEQVGHYVNISHLIDNLKTDPRVDGYVFLFGNQVIKITSNGLETIPPIPVQ